jgi:hypothetical protein
MYEYRASAFVKSNAGVADELGRRFLHRDNMDARRISLAHVPPNSRYGDAPLHWISDFSGYRTCDIARVADGSCA